MRVVIAPDSFKGSLDAAGVAAALAGGIRAELPDAEVQLVPVADGGEGTVAAALAAGWTPMALQVTGPTGDPVTATYAVDGGVALVELAAASGLGLLPRRDGRPVPAPLTAGSSGTGELVAAALDAGCTTVVLGVGGSACTDGGAGLLTALGVRLLDDDGQPVPPGGGGLARLARVDLSGLDPRLAVTDVVLASDVTNPLRGPGGAAAVFGPQKGADAAEVEQLDRGLGRLVEALTAELGDAVPAHALAEGAGAAGGVGFAALAVLGARRRPGIDVVLELVGLDALLPGADVVITGEGSLDSQTLGGKAPLGVARRAREHRVPTVVAVCGRAALSDQEARAAGFDRVHALTELEPDPERSMSDAALLLARVGTRIARDLRQPSTHHPDTPPPSTLQHPTEERPMPDTAPQQLAAVNDPDTIRAELARLRAERGEQAPDAPVGGAEVSSGFDLVVRGARIMTTAGIVAREIGVSNGKITALEPLGSGLTGARTVELADDETLLPGLVDAHVHVNEPGRTDWEGFASATRAAAAGGVTTILDMPLNSIPSTVNRPALQLKQWVAAPQVFVDVGFWGGAVPGNQQYLRELHDDGVFGFKCFLLHSGVDEFPPLGPDEFEEYLGVLRSYDALMIVHAEDSRSIDRAPDPEGDVYGRFLASRPRGAENLAIAEVIERTRWTGARTHVLHLSSSDALPMLRTAKADGLDLTVETCPHYLTLVSEAVPNGSTAYKCCPPIRETSNREKLWEGLLDGTIDYIASDHSPSTLDLKDLQNGDFGVAWGGIASVQLGLSVVWTEARRRGIALEQVVEWMAARPADRLRLRSKGRIALGYDADLAVFAADEAFVVDATTLHHKNPLTPYDQKALSGIVRRTFVRGTEVDYQTPRGRLIRRGID